ncbi:hypothetical protein HK44_020530 [Pseudomonas fluorescens HK44]|uniref:Prophage PSSB64-02 n=1 Tax=Pseudomonas fluorescens HK44 TaxID=1042209 RepID=A0A010TF45_PSEFL|nr:hypothetical protein [Pseudomonas fluorescens]EXF95782.1 hypothetical protein HK44_020530 [Pseudomonas fluorescens HK44]
MTDKISVNSSARLSEAITKLTAMFREKKFVVVSLRPGKDRTLDQNALWFALYQRISEMTQIGVVEDARRYCKLHFGVQILLNEDEDFRTGWYRTMRHLSYEEKLDLMGANALFGPDGFPVTRLFNRAQGIAFTDRIVDEFTAKGVFFSDILGEVAA